MNHNYPNKKGKEKTMSELDIVRAMKDEEYRASLSEEARALLPENPVGAVQLNDEELNSIAAGYKASYANTCTDNTYWACCRW